MIVLYQKVCMLNVVNTIVNQLNFLCMDILDFLLFNKRS